MNLGARLSLALLSSAALVTPLLGSAAAATFEPAVSYPVFQFGTVATETVTALDGNPSSRHYVAVGTTTGTFDTKTSAGGTDAFIRRTLPTGNTMRQFGTSGDDVPYDVDGSTVVGSTTGALPGRTNQGGTDGFVWGFAAGKTAWTLQLGTAGEDKVVGIAHGEQGDQDLYVVGTTTGTFAGQTSKGGTDYFVAHLTRAGELKSVTQHGTAGDDRAVGITIRTRGVGDGTYRDDPTVTGDTTGTFPGQTALGGRDLFVEGNGGGTKQFGTAGDDVALAGYQRTVVGSTTGTFPGQTSRGGTDAFLASPGRAYQFGSSADDAATAIAPSWGTPNRTAGWYVAGETDGALPGKNSFGGTDAFALRLDGDALRWRFQRGSAEDDRATAIVGTGRGVVFGGQTFGSISGQSQIGAGDFLLGRVTWSRPDTVAFIPNSSAPYSNGYGIFGGPTTPLFVGKVAHRVNVFAHNAGDQAEDLRFQGCRSNANVTVRYYAPDDSPGAKPFAYHDVTTAVRNGTYRAATSPGSPAAILASIKPTPGGRAGTRTPCTFKVSSTRSPNIYDDVTLQLVR